MSSKLPSKPGSSRRSATGTAPVLAAVSSPAGATAVTASSLFGAWALPGAAAAAGAGAVKSCSLRPAGTVDVAPVYSSEDSDLNVAFRRVGKKDSVTKVKALSELITAFPSRPRDLLLACVPHWAYLFPKLCLDTDRRVRIAAFQAFAELVRVLFTVCSIGR